MGLFARLFWGIAVFTLFISPDLCRADNLYGFGLGMNFSNFTNDSPASGATEFVAHAFVDWGLGDIWYLETGLRYNTYGASDSEEGGGSGTLSASYLEIPVWIKPTFNAGGWYPYLLAGPTVGFKVSKGISGSYEGIDVSESTNYFNTFDFLMNFGAGAELPIAGTVRGYVQFDYALGLINVLQSSTGSSSHTRGADVTVGAVLPF